MSDHGAINNVHTRNIAEFVSGLTYEAIPEEVIERIKLLILDSPTVGVDVGARAGIFAIIHKLAEQGMAILLISDEIPEVYFNADRILHMRNGRMVAEYMPGTTTVDQIERDVHA